MKLGNVVSAALGGIVFEFLVFTVVVATNAVLHGSLMGVIGGLVFGGAMFTGIGVLVGMEEKDNSKK